MNSVRSLLAACCRATWGTFRSGNDRLHAYSGHTPLWLASDSCRPLCAGRNYVQVQRHLPRRTRIGEAFGRGRQRKAGHSFRSQLQGPSHFGRPPGYCPSRSLDAKRRRLLASELLTRILVNPSDAETMRRLHRPRSPSIIGTSAIRTRPSAHSCDLRIGVAMESFT